MFQKIQSRLWEVDFIRGIAVVMMIFFHILFDLNFFQVLSIELYSGFMLPFALSIGTLFLFIVGVSLSLSVSRVKTVFSWKKIQGKIVFRGLKIFLIGVVITVVTWLLLREGFIIFGVLHCIGISVILGCLFLRFRLLNLFFGVVCIVIGIFLLFVRVDFVWLLWLGFRPYGFYTLDYFPLFPWFGVVLLGVFFGNVFYEGGVRSFSLNNQCVNMFCRGVCFLGRHSLVIYLVHQPVILGLLYVFGFIHM